MISMIRGSGVPGSIKPPRSLSSQTLSTHYPIPFRAVMFLSRPSAYGGLKLNVMMDSYPPATVPFGISHSKYLSELYKNILTLIMIDLLTVVGGIISKFPAFSSLTSSSLQLPMQTYLFLFLIFSKGITTSSTSSSLANSRNILFFLAYPEAGEAPF